MINYFKFNNFKNILIFILLLVFLLNISLIECNNNNNNNLFATIIIKSTFFSNIRKNQLILNKINFIQPFKLKLTELFKLFANEELWEMFEVAEFKYNELKRHTTQIMFRVKDKSKILNKLGPDFLIVLNVTINRLEEISFLMFIHELYYNILIELENSEELLFYICQYKWLLATLNTIKNNCPIPPTPQQSPNSSN
ncbi:Carboxypeptidase [Meloidogyne graminicola]|uniref:Carboxypeptidase n=1 Tax=Meloidogyne graminicola TaxID=189291 RepID=A0A8S9ZKK5_9BILA|nr:Carboxypeptidase [Meloidogyne graminicola]